MGQQAKQSIPLPLFHSAKREGEAEGEQFWFQGPDDLFRRRVAAHKSIVFRANIPPTFPFFLGVDPRVVALVDAASFTILFDLALVDKRDVLIGAYNPSVSFTGGTRVDVYLDTEEPDHARTKAFAMDLLRRSARTWATEFRARRQRHAHHRRGRPHQGRQSLLFVLGFNAFSGFSVFLPFLIVEVG